MTGLLATVSLCPQKKIIVTQSTIAGVTIACHVWGVPDSTTASNRQGLRDSCLLLKFLDLTDTPHVTYVTLDSGDHVAWLHLISFSSPHRTQLLPSLSSSSLEDKGYSCFLLTLHAKTSHSFTHSTLARTASDLFWPDLHKLVAWHASRLWFWHDREAQF